jgi:ABC-2 type transport system permease protein
MGTAASERQERASGQWFAAGAEGASGAGALRLLLRVNLLGAWRRLLAARGQSKLLTALIVCFLGGYLLLAFALFYKGLRFAGTFPGLGAVLVERMLFLLFAFLFVLLLLSNLLISYTNLFRNPETAFLLPLPVPPRVIFQWKFIESTLLASWAFLFLIAPLLAAYGLTQGARWHFYPITVGFIAMFIMLPAAAGAWLAVVLARHVDRRSFQVAALGLAAAAVAAAALWLKPEPITDEQLETRVLVVLDRLLQKTSFAQYPWLPSYWLSAGVLQWADGAVKGAVFFALVLLSHVLFFATLICARMGAPFYNAASAVQSRGSVLARWGWFRAWQERQLRSACKRGWLERAAARLCARRLDVRALLVKDVLVFWRDTTQWGQTVVLFGLLAVYILNLRHFAHHLTNPFWVYLVSYLNLAACALNLATLTTRFVYPQFSLEGKRLWIVGLAPLGLPRVLLAKFTFASSGSLALTLGLITLSCHMLNLAWERTVYLAGAVTVMTFTLNGLAIGLGALYPNFKEDNPSKIVSGFGGTFCLVLSFLYILASVILLAVGSPWTRSGGQIWTITLGCWVIFAGLSALVGWLPLKLGLRRVNQFEY